ncbi:hypothetical protein [Streptosporangium sp. V21-05]|uniref:hypothetical protein n=1 Tax=Streptosporangium sp. V21-05 TaxID=3446115 RepID=UPI003F532A3C
METLRAVEGGAARLVDGFEFAYVTANGVEVRQELTEAWATPLETGQPVHRLRPHKGQKHLPGAWWSATDGRLVGFEYGRWLREG